MKKDDAPDGPRGLKPSPGSAIASLKPGSGAQTERFYAQANAGRWDLSREAFAAALERSSKKTISGGTLSEEKVHNYFRSLHLEDLALAAACMENCDAAWEHFVAAYRSYLRSAAAAVLRCSSSSSEACDLADSLFAELYGLGDGARRERSLFRYFHGRSSLKTWLRAVLAQRHIDAIRTGRRFESLDDEESSSATPKIAAGISAPSADPHRERYANLFVRALQAAFGALDPRDSQRLCLYYAKQQTLAEIGRQLGEHESSVSRNLDRVRLALRRAVEETLRNGCPAVNGFAAEPGLSDAQISLCFEYASAEVSFDLERIMRPRTRPGSSAGRPDP